MMQHVLAMCHKNPALRHKFNLEQRVTLAAARGFTATDYVQAQAWKAYIYVY
jgi:hypothetical protein